MDPIAHTLVGAALAQSGLARRTAFGSAALIIGANLPDIDGITMLMDGDLALHLRRGWTHGIPALVVLPVLLTAVLILTRRIAARRSRTDGPPLRPRALLGLSYLAVWTHPSLDWLNTYGMRWLMPLKGQWFYGDSAFIVDPWIWLTLASAVFLFRSRTLLQVAGWTTFAILASVLLVRSVPDLLPAKIFWFGALALLIALRVRRIGIEESTARRFARAALVVATLYISFLVGLSQYGRRAVRQALVSRGWTVKELMVAPIPVNPFIRDVVARSGEEYRYGVARLFPRFELEISDRIIPRLADTAVIRAATASPTVRGFTNWVRFPFAEVEDRGSSYVVYLLDARYSRSRRGGFGSARVEVPKSLIDSEDSDRN